MSGGDGSSPPVTASAIATAASTIVTTPAYPVPGGGGSTSSPAPPPATAPGAPPAAGGSALSSRSGGAPGGGAAAGGGGGGRGRGDGRGPVAPAAAGASFGVKRRRVPTTSEARVRDMPPSRGFDGYPVPRDPTPGGSGPAPTYSYEEGKGPTGGGGGFGGDPVRYHPSRIDSSAITHAHSRVKKTKPIVRPSRASPVWNQSVVVTTAQFDRNAHAKRAATIPEKWICPLGSPDDFDVREGELVMCTLDRSTPGRIPSTHYPEVTAFSTVNGLAIGQQVYPLGVAMGGATRADGQYHTATFTVQRQGTVTIKHCGFGRIDRNARVAVTPIPVMYVASAGATRYGAAVSGREVKMPLVQEEGVPPTKFRPAIFAYSHHSVAGHAANLRGDIRRAVLMTAAAGATAGATIVDVLYKAGKSACEAYFAKDGQLNTMQPIQLYGYWYALECAVHGAIAAVAADAQWLGECKAARELATEIQSEEAAYFHLHAAANLFDIASAEEVTSAQWKLAIVDPVGSDAHAAKIKLTVSITQTIADHKDIAFGQHHEWCARSIIGRAITSADPGDDIDIILGIGNSV